MVLFVLNFIVAMFLAMSLLTAKSKDASSASNATTRYIRENKARKKYKNTITLGFIASVVTVLISLITEDYYACLPTILVLALAFYFTYMSNTSEQNKQDARVVTKTSGRIVQFGLPGVLGLILTVVLVIIFGIATWWIWLIIGVIVVIAMAISKVTGKCVDKMTDVEEPDIKAEDFKEVNAVASEIMSKASKGKLNMDINSAMGVEAKPSNVLSGGVFEEQKFLEQCEKMGYDTSSGVEAAIKDVIECSAPALLQELPEDMSDEDKAYYLVTGGIV